MMRATELAPVEPSLAEVRSLVLQYGLPPGASIVGGCDLIHSQGAQQIPLRVYPLGNDSECADRDEIAGRIDLRLREFVRAAFDAPREFLNRYATCDKAVWDNSEIDGAKIRNVKLRMTA